MFGCEFEYPYVLSPSLSCWLSLQCNLYLSCGNSGFNRVELLVLLLLLLCASFKDSCYYLIWLAGIVGRVEKARFHSLYGETLSAFFFNDTKQKKDEKGRFSISLLLLHFFLSALKTNVRTTTKGFMLVCWLHLTFFSL